MKMSQFAKVVRDAVDTLPPAIRRHLDNVVIDVEDEPSVKLLRLAGFSDEDIDAGDTLYGWYVPFDAVLQTEGSSAFASVSATDMLENLDRILIFKNPLEEDFPDRAELLIEIRKTVIHEIAHHFGWSDRDLERFDDDPDPFG